MSNLQLAVWSLPQTDFQKPGDAPDAPIDMDIARRRFDQMADAGVDLLLPYLTPEDGYFYYDAHIDNVKAVDRLTPIIELARERNIEVHPWVFPAAWTDRYPERRPGEDGAYISGKPGGHKADGVFCSSWAPITDVARVIGNDMMDHHDVHGIHLDVVRYREVLFCRDWPCQCKACSSLYQQYLGKPLLTAEDLKDPGVLFVFSKLRQDQIDTVVARSRELATQRGVKLSAALRCRYFEHALFEGQDWARWLREGIFDFVCTMNYELDRKLHQHWVDEHLALGGDRATMFHGIGRKSSMGELTAAQMLEQAQDILDAGGTRLCIFKLDPMGEEDFAALKSLKG